MDRLTLIVGTYSRISPCSHHPIVLRGLLALGVPLGAVESVDPAVAVVAPVGAADAAADAGGGGMLHHARIAPKHAVGDYAAQPLPQLQFLLVAD